MDYTVKELMKQAFNEGASDIHLTANLPPVFRVDGTLIQKGIEPLATDNLRSMVEEITPERKRKELEEVGEADFNFALEDTCRFRVNAFKQKQSYALALRLISTKIPSLDELGMGSVFKELVEQRQGLILVTGPTGSGKSTTLAAMIDHLNKNFSKHIITLEDPIEYLHTHQNSVINQREIGLDTASFASGLRASLRQDPDVILVGEMRDLETISTAITAAETGHLVLATLHTSTAASTIDRIIDVFPPTQQNQVRQQLSSVIRGVVSQRLIAKFGGNGRVAATEIMIQTPSISNLIRSEKIHQIPNVLQTSKAQGMHTIEMDVQRLLTAGIIDHDLAKPFFTAGEYR